MKKKAEEAAEMNISPFEVTDEEVKSRSSNEESENKHFYLEDYEEINDFHLDNKKQIITPKYYTNEEYEKMNILTWNKKFNEMYQNHFRLEYVEKHIINSNPQYKQDNCNVVNLLEEKNEIFNDQKFSKLENIQEKSNYSNVIEHNIKPSFWPARVFDKNYKKLNEKESTILSAQIQQYNIVLDSHTYEEPTIRNIINHRGHKSYSVSFSIYDFGTENDDDQTQWSDDSLL